MALTKLTRVTDFLIELTYDVVGTIKRVLSEKLSDSLSVLDFGADNTGVLPSDVAFTNAMQSSRCILVPAGTYSLSGVVNAPTGSFLIVEGTLSVTGNTTLACDVELRGAGSITVASGMSCSITGNFKAPSKRVFYGAGTIRGLKYVVAEWWGAVAYASITSSSVDSAQAINAALACLVTGTPQAGRRPTLEFLSGNYLVGSTLTANISASYGMCIKGQGYIFSGTRLVGASTFVGTTLLRVPGSTDSTQKIVNFKMQDFGLVPQTVGSGPTTLLGLGSAGNNLIGLAESTVQDLYFGSAPRQLEIINTRQVQFRNLGLWNNNLMSAGVNIFIEAREYFCGDLTFHNCQTVNSAGVANSRGIYLYANGTWVTGGDSGYMIAGIRFTECILYPADTTVYMTALGGSRIEDIFFMNNQWDGSSPCMLYAVSSGAGSRIRDIQVNNNYMYGGNTDTNRAALQFITSSSGVMGNIRVDGNTIGNAVNRAVNFTSDAVDSINGVFVNDNFIVDFNNPSTPAIEIGQGCYRVQVNNNVAGRLTGTNVFPYLVQFDNGAHHFVSTGNLGSGIVSTATVRDLTSTSDKVIANNL